MKHRSRLLLAVVLATGILAAPLSGQTRKRQLPAPLRLFIPYQMAWTSLLESLQGEQLPVANEDRVSGEIVTEYRDYIDGPLTSSHLAKIGIPPKLNDASWLRGRYRFEIRLELIAEKETLATANVRVEGLKREYLGRESWEEIPSNGRLETDFLTSYGKALFGEEFTLQVPKPGFWERAPGHVPTEGQLPGIARPERPPD